MRKSEPCQRVLPLQCSQVILPSKGSSGKASITCGCKLGCPSSCKGRGLVFRHKSQAKPPPRVFLPATASSERTQCGHVNHVSFQYHLPCTRTGRCLGRQAGSRYSQGSKVLSKEPETERGTGSRDPWFQASTLLYWPGDPERVTHPPEQKGDNKAFLP